MSPKSFIAERGRRKTIIDGHRKIEIYTRKYDPGDTLESHLTFALKFEGINLGILNALFSADYREFIMGEVRFSRLTRTFPENVEMLFEKAEEEMKERYAIYKRMAGQGE